MSRLRQVQDPFVLSRVHRRRADKRYDSFVLLEAGRQSSTVPRDTFGSEPLLFLAVHRTKSFTKDKINENDKAKIRDPNLNVFTKPGRIVIARGLCISKSL